MKNHIIRQTLKGCFKFQTIRQQPRKPKEPIDAGEPPDLKEKDDKQNLRTVSVESECLL